MTLFFLGGLAAFARADDSFREPALFPFDAQSSTAPALPDKTSRFVQQMSLSMDWPEEKLHPLESQGYARTEMILLVMMEKQTGENWDGLIKERQKGARLRAMAEKRGMPYNDLFRKAQRTKMEIDAAVEALPPEVETSTATGIAPRR